MITKYSVNAKDSETPSAWMSAPHVTRLTPGNQDSGRCRYEVWTSNPEALELALGADGDVESYERDDDETRMYTLTNTTGLDWRGYGPYETLEQAHRQLNRLLGFDAVLSGPWDDDTESGPSQFWAAFATQRESDACDAGDGDAAASAPRIVSR